MYTVRVYFFSFSLLFLMGLFFAPSAQAADPQFMVTWKADTKVPVWYEGKALPVYDSSVIVSVSLVEQNGSSAGKLIDLGNAEIRWYIKGELVQKGNGLTTLSVLNKDFAGNYIDIKIAIEYEDAAGGRRFIETYSNIPISQPEVVVEYRNIQPFFSVGSTVVMRAHPFFFTSSFLRPEWDIDGLRTVSDTYDISISNAPQNLRNVKFSVHNTQKIPEKAQAIITLQPN